MDPKLRFSIIIFLLLFVALYPARVNSMTMRVDVVKSPANKMKGRKVLNLATDDYKEYGANPRNDQGKTKPHG